jgi:hypothetical protein
MCQPIGSFEKCVYMYVHELQTPPKSNHSKYFSIEIPVTLFHVCIKINVAQ